MKSKTYVKRFIILFVASIALLAATVFVLDPYFHFHAPWFGLNPILKDESYQNPGIARHLEYDSIIVGSSLSENFDAGWFNDTFGVNTVKLTNSGASVENYRINIEYAEQVKNHQLKYVFCNIENNLLNNHTYNKPIHELPEYMYDDKLSNDIDYILNKDVLLDSVKLIAKNLTHTTGNVTTAYQWYTSDAQFSKEIALRNSDLSDIFEDVIQKPATMDENAVNGVKVLVSLVEDYPDTEFYFFYSPVSILYWLEVYKNGEVLSQTAVLEYSMEQLLKYDNVYLFFPSTYEMMTDLDNYKDDIHYSMDIQRLIFEQMRDGKNELTKDNYKQYIDVYREMILNYDYEKIFE